jgi:dTDP-4-amino-4,6-dideoxy-D-galactose acyltransferase
MYNGQIEYLTWDSNFFEKKIGRVFIGDDPCLEKTLLEAQNTGYRLIYVFADKDTFFDNDILKRFNGHLADKKILYEKKIKEKKENLSVVSEYKDNKLIPELELLAYESGKYSRFKLDRNFQQDDYYRMYRIWIENSVKKQIADNVFVVKDNDAIKGMVTLKIDGEKGYIGLIAVSADAQGKGYGQALINACENELFSNGIFKFNIFTQSDNIQGCKFYEKCGFQIKEISNIYHFWI